jgi:hypothetical protein
MDQTRIRRALDELIYLTPLKERGAKGTEEKISEQGGIGVCHPWDRNDLSQRLRSFKVCKNVQRAVLMRAMALTD